jgi:hypothetical protein
MAAKHFMIYYKKGTGTYVVTEPRPWSRENQHYFTDFNFIQNNLPTTNYIIKWLINNKGFVKSLNENDISVIQNLDPSLII